MLPLGIAPAVLLTHIAQAQEAGTLEDLMHEDFRVFLWAIWVELNLPLPTRIQLDVAEYLQFGPRRRMIQAFRGMGKSWITSAYVLWRLFNEPNERILVVSAAKDRADAFSLFTKRLIYEIEWLQYLRPDPQKEHRDSLIAFDVGPSDPHQAPSVRSVGVQGQMTGGRASLIIADDVEVPKNSLTMDQRAKLAESVKEFDAVLMSEQDLKAMGRAPRADVIYLGTPQCAMSMYNELPNRGYAVRIWPARYPRVEALDGYRGRLAPIITADLALNPGLGTKHLTHGAPTDPMRFDHMDLLEREAVYARTGFALQFMLDTSMSDANKYPLKLADLMCLDLNANLAPVQMAWGSGPDCMIPGPEQPAGLPVVGLPGDRLNRPMYVHKDFAPFQGCAMAIDPSGRGGDETGYAVVAMLHGMLFTLALGGLKGGYEEETLQELAKMAKRWQVKHIVIESNFGDGMFNRLFAPHLLKVGYPVTLEEVRSSIQKEKRIIDTLEPVFNQHRMIVNSEIFRQDIKTEEVEYQAFYQMTRITRDKGCLTRYDRLDAWAMAVAYWTERLDVTGDQALEGYRQQQLDQALEEFMNGVLGTKPKALNWTQRSLPRS